MSDHTSHVPYHLHYNQSGRDSICEIKIERTTGLAHTGLEARLFRLGVFHRDQAFGRRRLHIGQSRVVRAFLLLFGNRALLEFRHAHKVFAFGQARTPLRRDLIISRGVGTSSTARIAEGALHL